MSDKAIREFLVKHQLPTDYIDNITNWFLPVAEKLVEQKKAIDKPLIIGVNGSQGSGKSTLSDLLETLFIEQYQLNAVTLSLDDFYYTREERQTLAETIHPLLATRGVPGTHDVILAIDTINSLKASKGPTYIPRFDKSTDDRFPKDKWTLNIDKIDIIIFEGWCLGAEPQNEDVLLKPVNDLESLQDSNAHWRHYVNKQLADNYSDLFSLIDSWIMLKAPSFDVVFNWRLEQEQKLRASQPSSSKIMTDQQIAEFVKYYQRVTEDVLTTLPDKVNYLFELDATRKIIQLTQR